MDNISNKIDYKGGKHCIAPGCTNYYYKTPEKHFHALPLRDRARLAKWLHNLKRKNAPVNKHAHVCSDHFVDEDYEQEGFFDNETFSFRKSNRLIATAVPTKFNFAAYSIGNTDAPTTSAGSGDRGERVARRADKRDTIAVST